MWRFIPLPFWFLQASKIRLFDPGFGWWSTTWDVLGQGGWCGWDGCSGMPPPKKVGEYWGRRLCFSWLGVSSIQIIYQYQEWPLQEFQGWVTGNGRRFFWITWKMICLRFQLFVWRYRKRFAIYFRGWLKFLETIHTNPFACFNVFIHWMHLPKAFLIFRKEQVPNKDKDKSYMFSFAANFVQFALEQLILAGRGYSIII